MAIAKLDQHNKTVRFSEFEVSHELIFKYFDRLPEAQRDAALMRALQIGVVALLEDRIAAFLSRTRANWEPNSKPSNSFTSKMLLQEKRLRKSATMRRAEYFNRCEISLNAKAMTTMIFS